VKLPVCMYAQCVFVVSLFDRVTRAVYIIAIVYNIAIRYKSDVQVMMGVLFYASFFREHI
jgi:hypothetical protein